MSQQRGEGAGRRRRQRAPGVPARRGQGCAHGASVVEKPGLAGEPDHGQVRDAVKETGLGLAVQEQQQSAPGLAAARRAAHAVDVVLDLRGEVVVDDVLDVLHVKPTGRDVGRHQDRRLALLELLEHPVALLLLLVAVDAERGEAVEPHLARELVAAALGLAEDEDLGAVHHLLEQPLQAAPLVVLLHDLHVLPDGVRRPQVQGADVDVHGVLPADVSREPLHLPRPRGAPHQRLPVRADLRGDLPHLRLEAHVQHAVRLVEHEVGHALQVGVAALQEVDEAARGRDDHLDPVPEVAALLGAGHAAVGAGVLDLGAPAEAVGLLLDLDGQLAGRRHHEHNGPVAAREVGLRVDVHDGGQKEGERLAGARLRDADHVAPGERDGPALHLDRRGLLEAGARHLLQDVLREGRLLERPHGLRNVVPVHNGDVLRLPYAVGVLRRHPGDRGVLLVEVLLELDEAHLAPVDAPQVGPQVLIVEAPRPAARRTAAAVVPAAVAPVAAAVASITAAVGVTAAVATAAVHIWLSLQKGCSRRGRA
mmetsp:Transcript_110009/g.350887  ORF Transcript_110009/g.350887 Transcript_110009/m.350887 type:complete len:537 (+) Transcript_110009:384-1994(+)